MKRKLLFIMFEIQKNPIPTPKIVERIMENLRKVEISENSST